jgi:exonuclease III
MNVVISEITKYNLNIIALQEIRWPGNSSLKHKETTIFYSGCNDNRHAFGVGFMINNRLLENVKSFEAMNERICYIRLKIKEHIVIIFSCHALTEEKDGETKDIFYDELEQVYNAIPRHAIKIIL